jgi:hypothetical protein
MFRLFFFVTRKLAMKTLLVRSWQLSLLIGFAFPSQIQAGPRQMLQDRAASTVAGLRPVGVLPDSTRLNLALALPLRNKQALTLLLQDLYDPASPNYRRYLSPSEFAERFGPTRQDYEELTAFARSNRCEVTRAHANRTLLDVSATVADIRRAFGVNLKVYPHPNEKRNFYAPDGDPSVDCGVPLLAVKGLDDFVRPRPCGGIRPLGGSGTNGSYQGTDFRAAYAPGVSLEGGGQQVALVEFDGYYLNDILNYRRLTGSPAIGLTNVLVDGYSGLPDFDSASVGEVSLDIELVNAMAPGLSQILVYEEQLFSPVDDMLNQIATDDLANQISSSWIYDIDAVSDQIFQQYAAQGQSFFSASGDTGAYPPGQTEEPMESAYITVVGGTSLTTSASAGWQSETVWSDVAGGSQRASGGGYTTNYAMPAWQAMVTMTANGGSPAFRNIPDVACVAANVVVMYNNGTMGVFEGTSCAAPLWAGYTALVNQQAATYGNGPAGFLNPALYAIGASAGYGTNFHDITTGNNTNANSPDAYFAVAGYDLCTGWGTPNGSNLINTLAPPDTLVMLPIAGLNFSGPGGGPFDVTSQGYSLTNTGSAVLNWSLGSDVSWLSVSSASGTLSPGATAGIMVSLNAAASNLFVGSYTGHMLLTNLSDGQVHQRTFNLQISDPVAVGPSAGLKFGGPPSGPFSTATETCTLTNAGQIPVSWSVATNPPWINVDPSNGVLQPSGSVLVTCSLNAAATDLPAETYSASVLFSNDTFEAAEPLPAVLMIGQLVLNGGFETGNLMDWTVAGNPDETFVTSYPAYVHSGRYGLALAEEGAVAYLSQVIPTVPGVSYSISLWLYSPDGLGPNEFSVAWGGTTLFDYTNLPALGWTNLQFVVSATAKNTVLEIGSRDDASELGLDDVSVTAAPPTLLGLTPSAGPLAGGAAVTITGSGFQTDATVAFGSVAAASVTFNSVTNLTVVTPASVSAGPVNVIVTNADGQTATLTNGFLFVGTPAITWSNPPPIAYGSALNGLQLNASANVPGAISYIPPIGTVLNAGSNLLSAVFTPNDSVDYSSVTDYVGLVVWQAPLSVTASNATRPYGVDNPVFTGLLAGLQNGDNITANYSCAATPGSPAGADLIVPSLADPTGRLPNYQVSIFDGTLTVLAPVPPVFQEAALFADTFSLNWTATTGAAYQVQYISDLTATNWTDLGGLVMASNATAGLTDSITNSQRFYRVFQVPR